MPGSTVREGEGNRTSLYERHRAVSHLRCARGQSATRNDERGRRNWEKGSAAERSGRENFRDKRPGTSSICLWWETGPQSTQAPTAANPSVHAGRADVYAIS